MTDEDIRWLTRIVYQAMALTFVWVFADGVQFVFMPGKAYPWWTDDQATSHLYEAPEGYGGPGGRAH